MKQGIASPGKPARAAERGNAAVGAIGRAARRSESLDVHVEIIGHVQVEQAVVVVISERAPHAPSVAAHSGLVRHVCKGPVAIVAVEGVTRVIGHVEVIAAVVVIVPYADAHPPTGTVEARPRRDIRECSVAVIAEDP